LRVRGAPAIWRARAETEAMEAFMDGTVRLAKRHGYVIDRMSLVPDVTIT
jgi:hypothetical protein